MRRTFSALLLLLALRVAAPTPAAPADAASLFNVLPLPTSLTASPGCLLVSPELAFIPTGPGGGGSALQAALQRAAATLRSACARGEAVLPAPALAACAAPQLLASVEVRVAAPPSGAPPALGDDEAYNLTLAPGSASLLAAGSLWGALRGLETLTQLASCDGAPDAARSRLLVPAAAVSVQDAPRFSHRGLMLDTGRAFLPVSTLLAALDAMAYSKLNVLHWHISDDESFPLQSAALPNLTAGAFQAPSRSHTYSRADLQAVVAAASARGIRVIPELDVPGHTQSWFAGYPALASPCSGGGAFTVPMDPTLNSTYELLGTLFAEVSEVFPETLFHIGGDEVEFECWLSCPSIVAFMAAHGMTQPAQLQLYFEARVAALLRGRRPVIWEENFGAASAYPPSAIVQVWKEAGGNLTVMEGLLKAGYTVIYSTRDWYTDWAAISSTAYDDHVNGPRGWAFYHSIDPLPANTSLAPAEAARLLGGEVCAWSPYTDASNVLATAFPRAAAVAERLWSAQGGAVDAPGALAARMQAHRCRLLARGLPAAPVAWGASCPAVFAQAYVPPY